MKGFVLDENLPQKLTFAPTRSVTHARSLGVSLTDSALWNHARENEFVIVSKDADFSHRMLLTAPPPRGWFTSASAI